MPSSRQPKRRKKKLYSMLRVVAAGKSLNRFVGLSNSSISSTHTATTCSSCSSSDEEDQPQHHNTVPLDQQASHHERSRKCVSFSTNSSFRKILSSEDYSSEELQATWYTQDEYMKLQKSCCKEILKMDRGESLKDRKYCSRGLESHTRTGRALKSRNKVGSVQVVLEEQESQIHEGRPRDDAAIALAYQRISSSCRLWARVTGIADERAAEDFDDILENGIVDSASSSSSSSSTIGTPPSQSKAHDAVTPINNIVTQDLPYMSCVTSMVARTA